MSPFKTPVSSDGKDPLAELADHFRHIILGELSNLEARGWVVERVESRVAGRFAEPMGTRPNVYVVEVMEHGMSTQRPPFALMVLAPATIMIRRGSRAREFQATDGAFLPVRNHLRTELKELVRKTNR